MGGGRFHSLPAGPRTYNVEPVATGDLILTEVLQGFVNVRGFNQARRLLTSLVIVDLAGKLQIAAHGLGLRWVNPWIGLRPDNGLAGGCRVAVGLKPDPHWAGSRFLVALNVRRRRCGWR
jgi:hypothetical protein